MYSHASDLRQRHGPRLTEATRDVLCIRSGVLYVWSTAKNISRVVLIPRCCNGISCRKEENRIQFESSPVYQLKEDRVSILISPTTPYSKF
ncbi:hypothetical protein E2C01_075953 [Portunus trituberculatus]|uniref:Uncharacterized protein n=1 Tax=Portunus trituberculatus TaxID=210409 RepID=A0A5B7IG92_PORTR|nr:hypothetical protein [Portunus trituberculatus]